MEIAGCPGTVPVCSECRCINCSHSRYMSNGQCPVCMFCSNGSAMKPLQTPCAIRKVKSEPKESSSK